MNSALAFYGGVPVIKDLKYTWPIISDDIKDAVIEQLYDNVSIYDRSGIIEKLEDLVCDIYGKEYALLTCSGTLALYSAFYALDLDCEDEIICTVYTFFATCTPLFHINGKIKLVDCTKNGSISFEEVKRAYTYKTKAVVITHMWGRPVDEYEEIAGFCKRNGIYLVEDCSHAHGAMINGHRIGTYGDISIFSLQGNKVITGGEGGVLITDNEELYYRSIFLGHYNKRCKQEIPQDHYLYQYATTGAGLKFRIHPIAAQMAYRMFLKLDDIVAERNTFIKRLEAELANSKLLKVIESPSNMRHGAYAFTMLYKGYESLRITKKLFVDIAKAEGVVDIDSPGSTKSLSAFPLFFSKEVKSHLNLKASVEIISNENANYLSDNLLKLPCWQNEEAAVAYAAAFRKIEECLCS